MKQPAPKRPSLPHHTNTFDIAKSGDRHVSKLLSQKDELDKEMSLIDKMSEHQMVLPNLAVHDSQYNGQSNDTANIFNVKNFGAVGLASREHPPITREMTQDLMPSFTPDIRISQSSHFDDLKKQKTVAGLQVGTNPLQIDLGQDIINYRENLLTKKNIPLPPSAILRRRKKTEDSFANLSKTDIERGSFKHPLHNQQSEEYLFTEKQTKKSVEHFVLNRSFTRENSRKSDSQTQLTEKALNGDVGFDEETKKNRGSQSQLSQKTFIPSESQRKLSIVKIAGKLDSNPSHSQLPTAEKPKPAPVEVEIPHVEVIDASPGGGRRMSGMTDQTKKGGTVYNKLKVISSQDIAVKKQPISDQQCKTPGVLNSKLLDWRKIEPTSPPSQGNMSQKNEVKSRANKSLFIAGGLKVPSGHSFHQSIKSSQHEKSGLLLSMIADCQHIKGNEDESSQQYSEYWKKDGGWIDSIRLRAPTWGSLVKKITKEAPAQRQGRASSSSESGSKSQNQSSDSDIVRKQTSMSKVKVSESEIMEAAPRMRKSSGIPVISIDQEDSEKQSTIEGIRPKPLIIEKPAEDETPKEADRRQSDDLVLSDDNVTPPIEASKQVVTPPVESLHQGESGHPPLESREGSEKRKMEAPPKPNLIKIQDSPIINFEDAIIAQSKEYPLSSLNDSILQRKVRKQSLTSYDQKESSLIGRPEVGTRRFEVNGSKKYNDIDLFSDNFNRHSKLLTNDPDTANSIPRETRFELPEQPNPPQLGTYQSRKEESELQPLRETLPINFDLNSLSDDGRETIGTDRVIEVVLPQFHQVNLQTTLQMKQLLSQIDVPETIIKLNQRGMESLSFKDYKTTHLYLKAAGKLVNSAKVPTHISKVTKMRLVAIVFNNLGCYYKRIRKPNVALKYMKEALAFEKQCDLPLSHTSSTKLNICAILSQMDRHPEAIKYAQSAINDLIFTLKVLKIKMLKNPAKREETMKEHRISAAQYASVNIEPTKESREALHQTMGISYYNLAVEFEFCRAYERAVECFLKASYFVRLNRSVNNEVFLSQIEQNIKSINQKQEHKSTSQARRSLHRNLNRTSNLFSKDDPTLKAFSNIKLTGEDLDEAIALNRSLVKKQVERKNRRNFQQRVPLTDMREHIKQVKRLHRSTRPMGLEIKNSQESRQAFEQKLPDPKFFEKRFSRQRKSQDPMVWKKNRREMRSSDYQSPEMESQTQSDFFDHRLQHGKSLSRIDDSRKYQLWKQQSDNDSVNFESNQYGSSDHNPTDQRKLPAFSSVNQSWSSMPRYHSRSLHNINRGCLSKNSSPKMAQDLKSEGEQFNFGGGQPNPQKSGNFVMKEVRCSENDQPQFAGSFGKRDSMKGKILKVNDYLLDNKQRSAAVSPPHLSTSQQDKKAIEFETAEMSNEGQKSSAFVLSPPQSQLISLNQPAKKQDPVVMNNISIVDEIESHKEEETAMNSGLQSTSVNVKTQITQPLPSVVRQSREQQMQSMVDAHEFRKNKNVSNLTQKNVSFDLSQANFQKEVLKKMQERKKMLSQEGTRTRAAARNKIDLTGLQPKLSYQQSQKNARGLSDNSGGMLEGLSDVLNENPSANNESSFYHQDKLEALKYHMMSSKNQRLTPQASKRNPEGARIYRNGGRTATALDGPQTRSKKKKQRYPSGFDALSNNPSSEERIVNVQVDSVTSSQPVPTNLQVNCDYFEYPLGSPGEPQLKQEAIRANTKQQQKLQRFMQSTHQEMRVQRQHYNLKQLNYNIEYEQRLLEHQKEKLKKLIFLRNEQAAAQGRPIPAQRSRGQSQPRKPAKKLAPPLQMVIPSHL